MLGDGLAERAADLRVFGREPQRAFRDADAAGGDVDASELQAAGRLVEALALEVADQVIGRDAVVLEDQLGRIDRLVAELLQLAADAEAGLLRSDEQAHALVARLGLRIGLHQQREAGALDAVGDPGLGAVDDVVIALAPGGHPDALQVGAGVGLGQCKPAANVSARKGRQPAPLLRLGAEFLDRECQHQVGVEDAGDRHPDRGDAHDDLRIGRGGQAEAAVVGADGGAEQAERLHLRDDLGRPAIRVIVLLDDRPHVALEPPIDGGKELSPLAVLDNRPGLDDGHRGRCPFRYDLDLRSCTYNYMMSRNLVNIALKGNSLISSRIPPSAHVTSSPDRPNLS